MAKSKFDRLLGAQLGLEDDDTTTTGDEEILSAAAQPESDMADMAPDVAEMEEASDTAEALTDSSAELEEVAEALSASAKAGGISTESAVYARLAIRGIVGRHSMALADAMVPSMESFGGSSSRQRATASMEGAIVEALKSFWNAIVAKMKKLFAYVKNWIMKVFGAAPKLKARAIAIGKKAANITGAAEEKTMDLSLVHQLQVDSKAPPTAAAVGHAKDLSKVVSAALGNATSGSYEAMFTKFETLLDDVDKVTIAKGVSTLQDHYKGAGKATVDAVELAVIDANLKATAGLTLTKSTDAARWGTDVEVNVTANSFGDKIIAVSESTTKTTTDGFTIARYVRNCNVRITDHSTKPKDVDNNGSFKTLSSSEIRSLCDEVEDICDSIITYKKSWESRDKQFNKMDSSAKKAINAAEKDKDEVTVKPRLVKDAATAMSAALRYGINYETSLITYSLAVGRALLTWCERSVAQYKSS